MTGKGMLDDMAFLTTRMFVLSLLPLLVIPTHAQKQERPCNVVARVNGDIITEQAYLAALKDFREISRDKPTCRVKTTGKSRPN